MHVKQITISNFRSFRQQPEIQPFSVSTNVVVGRNGSGKSNLFDAVQFALLAPRFANLRQEERQAILHEGSGSAAVNAFVEIVFDNSDGRFSLENSDEVVLRRTIGLKKDEFFLQSKRANKGEVQSLLEGAGFSKSNPYFIVQQGKVQDLCTMSDTERLVLLKEVAGTTVYDEKKAESLLKMEENATRCQKIQEILVSIEERLSELQSEKEELVQYQSLDRQRRALEYTLYDKELSKARATLDALEHERQEQGSHLSDLHNANKTHDETLRNVQGNLKTKATALRRNTTVRRELEADAKTAVQTVAKLSLDCAELQAQVKSGQEQLQTNAKELAIVQQEIHKAQMELANEVSPAYTAARAALQDLQDRSAAAQQQQDALYAKQGRGRQFSTKQDRDAFLQSSLEELASDKANKTVALQQERDRLSNLRRSMEQDSKDVSSKKVQAQQWTTSLTQLSKRMDETKRQRLASLDTRKEEWRKSSQLQEQVREARDSFHKALAEQRKTMPRATHMGLEALKSIVAQAQDDNSTELQMGVHYFGTVMENFTLTDERYRTAVEVAAQNSLFHVIVDTDQTAARLMEKLSAEKLGRVTFLPLNQLRIDTNDHNATAIPENTNDVRPLLDLCVSYDAKVERAMQHVFGKKLLCRTAELAGDWSHKLGVDAITLDGDLCSRKGSMTGGYVDATKSRLRALAQQQEAKAHLASLETEYKETNARANQVDQEAANLLQELSRLQGKHAELDRLVSDAEKYVERLTSRQTKQQSQAEACETTAIPALERDVAMLDADMGRLSEEMGTELTETLSAADRELLQQLQQTQAELQPQMEAQNETVSQLGVQRQKLTSLLQDNLQKRAQELTEGIAGDDDANNNGGSGGNATTSARRRRSSLVRLSSTAIQAQRCEDLEERQQQLEDAQRVKETVDVRLAQARDTEATLRHELEATKNELEKLKNQDMKNQKALEEAQEKSDRLWNKRSMCISKRETYMRKIQELGSLPPPSELEKFSGKSMSTLMASLEDVNKKLKKYSHVNKKAYDQYVNFNEQRESLLKRKEELDQGAEKVQELVDSLDLQKDEAINRTFRGVSAHFKDVFKELVPNGAGELIMRAAVDETAVSDNEEDSDDDVDEDESPEAAGSKKKKAADPNNPDVSLYRGIGIKVRFSAVGENYLMSQLSGGQKALVAMTLIFAIQRCDPAPFYLFDELDQALDSTYRAAVASLIERQANNEDNPTQFIVSTFRPELVSVANRCYGISHQNKVSSIHPLSKKDALSFVANLMSEEEAVGEVSNVRNNSSTNGASMASRFTNNNNLESRKRKSAPAASPKGKNDDDDEDGGDNNDGAVSTSTPGSATDNDNNASP